MLRRAERACVLRGWDRVFDEWDYKSQKEREWMQLPFYER